MKSFYHNAPLLILPLLLFILSPRHYNLVRIAWADHPSLILTSVLLVFIVILYATTRPRPIYLVDLACYKPADANKATHGRVIRQFCAAGALNEESQHFQQRIIKQSGLGHETYLPESLMCMPPDTCLATAKAEAIEVVFGAVDEILAHTLVRPEDIGVLIVNCSLYNPTPSLSEMVAGRYKFRDDVICYNLSGMGCSAGLISVDLAKRLLQVHPNTYALLVSTENLTLNGYFGNNRSMLITNTLFRMGGAAILLSNHPSDCRSAKYQLLSTIRTHKGAEDTSYFCVTQEEDTEGHLGITLSKDLMIVASKALKANITTLGPFVLPVTEQLLFLKTLVLKKVFKMQDLKPYIPNFKLAFEHFLIHAGGRGVLDALEKNLQLSEWHMEPSRMTLYRFGNTSSSSLWYELAYCEAKGRIRRGDRVWQVAFGSGFKCNSAVWRAIRTIDPTTEGLKKNPWTDELDRLPVGVI